MGSPHFIEKPRGPNCLGRSHAWERAGTIGGPVLSSKLCGKCGVVRLRVRLHQCDATSRGVINVYYASLDNARARAFKHYLRAGPPLPEPKEAAP